MFAKFFVLFQGLLMVIIMYLLFRRRVFMLFTVQWFVLMVKTIVK